MAGATAELVDDHTSIDGCLSAPPQACGKREAVALAMASAEMGYSSRPRPAEAHLLRAYRAFEAEAKVVTTLPPNEMRMAALSRPA